MENLWKVVAFSFRFLNLSFIRTSLRYVFCSSSCIMNLNLRISAVYIKSDFYTSMGVVGTVWSKRVGIVLRLRKMLQLELGSNSLFVFCLMRRLAQYKIHFVGVNNAMITVYPMEFFLNHKKLCFSDKGFWMFQFQDFIVWQIFKIGKSDWSHLRANYAPLNMVCCEVPYFSSDL